MTAIMAPHIPDYAYEGARSIAAKRHNAVLKAHTAYPVSYGMGIYLVCGCGAKFTFAGHEDHCRQLCLDTPVKA